MQLNSCDAQLRTWPVFPPVSPSSIGPNRVTGSHPLLQQLKNINKDNTVALLSRKAVCLGTRAQTPRFFLSFPLRLWYLLDRGAMEEPHNKCISGYEGYAMCMHLCLGNRCNHVFRIDSAQTAWFAHFFVLSLISAHSMIS
jgi:hypothetical protein